MFRQFLFLRDLLNLPPIVAEFSAVQAGSVLTIGGVSLHFLGPQRQVVPEQLHDESGVFVKLVLDVVKVGDGVIEGCSRHLASLVRILLDLVVEDAVVEGEAQADGVSGLEALLGFLISILIGLKCALGGLVLVLA